jgi:hypothetical protein
MIHASRRSVRRMNRSQTLVELLEARRLLSGGVRVSFDAEANTVHVVGDDKPNEIFVGGEFMLSYTIQGLDGTRVNGGDSVSFPAAGFFGQSFVISLGNGDDSVQIGEPGDPITHGFSGNAISIATGNGNDNVGIFGITSFGGVQIATGNGDDQVQVDFANIDNGLSIDTGNGNDTLEFGNTGTGVTVFSNDIDLNGGRGNDVLDGIKHLHTFSTGQVITIENFETIL